MALTATIYHFDVDLADHDRRVYDTLALRMARHPSESEEYLWTRVLAYALEFTSGLELSKGGLSVPDDPAMSVRDLTGALRAWIEVGTPDAARLHRAAKAAPRVAVYTHKDPGQLLRRLAGERIHRSETLEIYSIERSLIAALVTRLDRRMTFALSVSERDLSLSLGTETLTGTVTRHSV